MEADHATGVFKTQGDNPETSHNMADNYDVKYADVIGYVREADVEDATVGGVGAVIGFLRSSLGFFLCVVLPLILFFLYELYNFISLITAERAKKKPVSAETEEEIKRRAIEEYLQQQAAANNLENNGEAQSTPDDNSNPTA